MDRTLTSVKSAPNVVELLLDNEPLRFQEKDDRDNESVGEKVKLRPHSAKSGSGKGSKQSGKNSRRDSVGVVTALLEPPPSKQRRGSLQLPFREHFFAKSESKNDTLKVYDDAFQGSIRGRNRGANLSVDDSAVATPSISPGGTLTDGKKNKTPKLSVVNLFANKDREKLEQLNELLNTYSAKGLPGLPELLAIGKKTSIDEAVFELEPHWKHFVEGHEKLPRKQQEHQEAIWELFITEVSYIRHLRVIIDVFKNSLINLQQEGLLNEIDTEKLFSNIVEIYECNAGFFEKYLYPVLLQGRSLRQPLDLMISKEAFVNQFPKMFYVYFKYFQDHKKCLEYAKTCMENDLFKTFITWAEGQKQCNRFKMSDLLVAPMQRLLKYSLLLQAILKFTEQPRDKDMLGEMIKAVDKLCFDANQYLQRREDLEKLEAVVKTIDSYDGVEAPTDECTRIVQEYNGNFNLVAPMPGCCNETRCFLFHTSLRMKEMQLQKADVECLLFTDLILICKNNRKLDKFKVIRPPMSLNQLVVSELKDKGSFLLIYLNEYHVPISAFTFQGDVKDVRNWLEKFKEAKAKLERRKAASVEVAHEEVVYTPVDNPDLDQVHRSDSMESTDRCIPNISYADPGSNATLSGQTAGLHNQHLQHHHLPSLSTSNSTGTLQSPNTDNSPDSLRHTDSDLDYNKPNNAVQSGRPVSFCGVPHLSGIGQDTLLSQAQQSHSADNGKTFSVVIEDTDNHPSVPHSSSFSTFSNANLATSRGSLSEQSNDLEDDLAKMKLHSRRTSRTEKRYHTADAIQDMKNKDKDTSIHKRLSWRQEEQMHEHKNLGSKVLSSDSVRSIPSSSGVSSTGSLLLNLESDISEESEGNSTCAGSARNDMDSSNNNTNSINNNLSATSTHNNNSLHFNIRRDMYPGDEGQPISDEDEDDNMIGKPIKSKSTPDLSRVLSNSVSVSKIEDGIASVAVGADSFHRKFTHAEFMKRKRLREQILVDANIESSEV